MGLQKTGRTEEALKCYNRAIEENSESSIAYYYKGNLLVDLGKNEEAIECFDRAIEINPNKSLFYIIKLRLLLGYNRILR